MRLKRFVIGVIAAMPMVFLVPGEAAAACVQAVNVSVEGDATQNCTETITLSTPALPGL